MEIPTPGMHGVGVRLKTIWGVKSAQRGDFNAGMQHKVLAKDLYIYPEGNGEEVEL